MSNTHAPINLHLQSEKTKTLGAESLISSIAPLLWLPTSTCTAQQSKAGRRLWGCATPSALTEVNNLSVSKSALAVFDSVGKSISLTK